jgi:ParB-like chromosome segregation protein Spo0J
MLDKPAKWPASKIEKWPIESVHPSPRNPRKHSNEQVDQIAASMRQFGFTIPLLVDEDGEIIAGHGRLLGAKKNGWPEVPVMVARGWSEPQKKAYRIADNKLTENSEWDDDLLRLEFGDLHNAGFDLALSGFDPDAIADFTGVVQALDGMPNLPDGDRQPYQQITITLHDDQVAIVKQAMILARAQGEFDEALNENGNGNAIARIAEFYLQHNQ